MSRHPNQLLPTEVDIVKNYLIDEYIKHRDKIHPYGQ